VTRNPKDRTEHGYPVTALGLQAEVWSEGDAMTPHHPEVRVRLVGEDGNAFSILGRVRAALRRAEVPQEEVEAFMREATSEDYDRLIQTVLAWVSTD
jgi:hypothetical protein